MTVDRTERVDRAYGPLVSLSLLFLAITYHPFQGIVRYVHSFLLLLMFSLHYILDNKKGI